MREDEAYTDSGYEDVESEGEAFGDDDGAPQFS